MRNVVVFKRNDHIYKTFHTFFQGCIWLFFHSETKKSIDKKKEFSWINFEW